MMKLASSAAHVTGRTSPRPNRSPGSASTSHVPLSQLKPAADYLFLAGVNHLFFHGTPYSPDDAPGPAGSSTPR